MTQLNLAGESGALDNINTSQGQFREQIAALNDMVRQIAGDAAVVAGNAATMDPLSAPFTLYVNPYTGSDKFVGGSYNDFEASGTDEEIIAQKLKRLELQRMTCGFTPQRPFKTINRAIIEAAIITSKDWYTYTDPRAHVDCVSIVLSPGVHTLYNDPGSASSSLTSWSTEKDPSTAELIAFNPPTVGGVLLPRGCSLCGPDLRKTTIRPNWVPTAADEAADYSNRRGMLKITGTGYFFGFTAMDKVGATTSHHLLDVFHFASKSELDLFYDKCFSAVGTGADLSEALTATRGTEYQIVGPIDTTTSPTSAWDTTASASPYIFNCSVRSDYGMGGAFMDGSKVSGLKSMVCANFTGVSLQKDMSCWQRYDGGAWTTTTYEQYISTDPDNIRMKPTRLSRHISAINDAFIQEVSVFAIGQGVHHFTDLGGEITVTNSNSSFGGCAAYSRGYKAAAFPSDQNWTVSGIRVPLDLQYKIGNVRYIYLGTTATVNSSTVTLVNELAVDASSSSIPAVLLNDGYSLADGTKIWIENPLGEPWYANLSASAWDSATPGTINITGAFTGTDPTTDEEGANLLEGKRIYIRRIVDTRTPAERRLSVLSTNTASARLPQRNFILQTDPDRSGGAISRVLAAGGDEVFTITNAGAGSETGVASSAEFTLRRGAPGTTYANNTLYPAGSVVRYGNKHYSNSRDIVTTTAAPDTAVWLETFVHTASTYNAEDPTTQEGRLMTLDTDTDTDPYSEDLGINWSTIWSSAGSVRDQYRASTDYKGAHAFLVALGFTDTAAHTALLPRAADSRVLDPTSPTDFPTAPSGGAATGRGNWAIEFRRPSVLRLYGHAWEWAGFLNYSKSIPAAQKDLSPQNAFTYYFTNEAGGRVVPQGSNENGFNVSPRGLEDVETGATLTVDSIGSSTIDIAEQTQFDSLQVEELRVTNINITGSITGLPDVGNARTDTTGPVYLADTAKLRSLSVASTDAAINAAPYAVTVGGLNYWKQQNNFLSAPVGTQYLYVDPVNGRDLSFNAVLADPPVTPSKAIKNLFSAVRYANSVYTSSTTVEYRVGPGFINAYTITFETRVSLRAWDFSAGNYLSGDTSDGTIPFLGGDTPAYGNYIDPTKQPVFGTSVEIEKPSYDTLMIFTARPTQLIFNQDAAIRGFAWWGITDSITAGRRTGSAAAAIVPDSYFTGRSGLVVDPATWRTAGYADPDNALNYFIRANVALNSDPAASVYKFYGWRARPAVIFRGKDNGILNCAFGAIAAAEINVTGGDDEYEAIVYNTQSGSVVLNGVRLFGNVKISSEVNTGSIVYNGDTYDTTKIRYREGNYTISSYRFTGFAYSFIGTGGEGAGKPFPISFGSNTRYESSSGYYISDYGWNNLTLLNESRSVATSDAAAQGTGWKTIGPAFGNFINRMYETAFSERRIWNQFRLKPGGYSAGVSGMFGCYDYSITSGTGEATKRYTQSLNPAVGIRVDPLSVSSDYGTGLWRVAGSGDQPLNADYTDSLTAGEIGGNNTSTSSVGLFTDLNLKVRGFKQGVSTATADIVTITTIL